MKKNIVQAGQDVFSKKRVLVRVDFNVPQNEDGTISDDSRIRAALPTINYLREAGARVVLMSHLGRPKGKDVKYSLRAVADRLQSLCSEQAPVRVVFASQCVGEVARQCVDSIVPGEVCLLENLRFHKEEEKNDPEFARQLAELGDIYVDDAFGTAHRAHASTEGVACYLRPALAGLLMEREIRMLSQALDNPVRPLATIIGGAKVSTKIGVLQNLLTRVDILVIGGAMAFSFLKARGMAVGKSLVEDDRLDYCRQIISQAEARGVNLVLPVDVVCAAEMKENSQTCTVSVEQMPPELMGLDVGPETSKRIDKVLRECRTILWNGPLGVFEMPSFANGTFQLIDTLVQCTKLGAKTVVGGGDSVAALAARGVGEQSLTHVSTGGGASLEFIEGLELPGIACLDEAEPAMTAQ